MRRAVPLAIALLNISSPDMMAMDTLGRLSHDTDTEVAQNAVLALGLMGAGEKGRGKFAGDVRGMKQVANRLRREDG